MGRTWEARVAKYQNSPKLAYRTKAGPWASAWVFGTMGLYRTRVHLKDDKESSCTCPFEGFPCKHIVALGATFEEHPRTFKDFEKIVANLRKKRPRELVRLIEQIVERHPSALQELGVKGPRAENGEGEWD